MIAFSLIMGTIALVILGVLLSLLGLFAEKTYGSALESYIVSRNPKTHAEVEKLQFEYELKQAKDRFI